MNQGDQQEHKGREGCEPRFLQFSPEIAQDEECREGEDQGKKEDKEIGAGVPVGKASAFNLRLEHESGAEEEIAGDEEVGDSEAAGDDGDNDAEAGRKPARKGGGKEEDAAELEGLDGEIKGVIEGLAVWEGCHSQEDRQEKFGDGMPGQKQSGIGDAGEAVVGELAVEELERAEGGGDRRMAFGAGGGGGEGAEVVVAGLAGEVGLDGCGGFFHGGGL